MASTDFYNFATPIGGAVGSVLNFASTLANNYHQEKLQQQAQQWNAQQAALANQWSIDQWNRENEYNDPKNQMARLQAAGINPALAYANGVFNQAATSPDVQTPAAALAARTQAPQVDPMLLSNLQIADAQRDLLKSQADEAEANAALANSRVPLAAQEIENLKQQADESAARANEAQQNANLAIEKCATEKERREEIKTQRNILVKEHNRAVAETKAQIALWKSQGLLNAAEANKFNADAALITRKLFELRETWLDRLNEQHFNAESAKFKSMTDYVDMRKSIVELEGYGIFYNPETNTFDVDYDVVTKIGESQKAGWIYAEMVSEIIGRMFGVALGFGGRTTKIIKSVVN